MADETPRTPDSSTAKERRSFLDLFHQNKPKSVTPEKKKENKRKYENESRKRVFQITWLKEFDWLRFDNTKNVMVCETCQQYDTVGVFVTGSTFFRKDSVKAHELSDGHKFNQIKFKSPKDSSSIAANTLKKLNEKTIGQLSVKFRNTHYICKKARPFTDYRDLCNLSESQKLDVGNTYRSNKSATDFAHYIGEVERIRIRNEIDKSKFISVISDGTTDASFQEAEIIYCRTADKGTIKVYFSLVKNVAHGNAETIFKVMEDGLANLSNDYKSKLVATGTDGASVMLGSKSGAVQRLKEAVDRPYIVGVHCNGHKLELAYKDTLKTKILLYNKVELFLTNLYYFYRNSNVTRSDLKESFKATGKNVVLPTRVSGTRWVGHMKIAIEAFLKGYEAIVLHLAQLQNRDVSASRTEKGNKAKHFYTIARSKSVWLMLHFLLDVLHVVVEVSKKFQLRTATMAEVLTEIEFAVKDLEKLKHRDGLHLRKAVDHGPDDLTGNDISFVSSRRRLLSAMVDSLHRRFTDTPGILASTSVFSMSVFPDDEEDLQDYGDTDVDQLTDHFEPALEAAGVEVGLIAHEWTKLKHHIHTRFVKPSSCTWADVNSKLGRVCPNILGLVDLVLTIPASSADAERGFSYLKNTKTATRSKLLDCHLSDQLTIVLESEPVQNYDPLPAIDLWNSTPRRVRQEKKFSSKTVSNVSRDSAAVVCVSTESADVCSMSAESTEVGSVSTESAEVGSVGTESADVCSMSIESAEVGSVSTESAEVGSVSTESAEVGSVSTESAEVGSVSTESAEVGSVGTESADVCSMSIESAEVGNVSTESAEVGSVSTESAEVGSVSTESAEVDNVSTESAEVGSVSTEINPVPSDSEKDDVPQIDKYVHVASHSHSGDTVDSEKSYTSSKNVLVGSDNPFPIFANKSTQTFDFNCAMDESDEEDYTSDCDYYDNEFDGSLFEKKIEHEERLTLAIASYSEFLSVMNENDTIIC